MYEIAPLLDDPIHNLKTIRDLYRWAVTELETSDLSFGTWGAKRARRCILSHLPSAETPV